MASRIEIRHVFRCPPDHFWANIFANTEFDEALYRGHLGFPSWEILERHDEDDGTMRRRVKSTPKTETPAAVRKVIGDNVSYVESGKYDPKRQRYVFDIEPSRLPEKISIHGEMWSEAHGDGHMRRLVDFDVSVKIFGVGRIVEKFVGQSLRENYEKAAEFTNRWIAGQSGG